ncbi:ABC transporter permease [Halalkalicoccus jeotgali]|uniref:ABC-2 type transporter n=1 Tax=Halalkalicoccus jeotgali (strain DSM 18796 / CECT 7217 / JCM 14584 / KCTC 4019 / B3) TaxID=795797 RepID=D8J7A8_HALJB|nr:ABC transporter permease [Halalkalicoccus jeotgali]ADJ14003.1 ABC-2 type transporter [Halalkalicoccus jeotgali B3]ELY33951.1 ABC-2 type transporter [Halalkalicoccus jeotgali B3]
MKLVDPQSIYALWLRDVKRFLRTPSRIVGSIAMPLLFLVFLGFGFSGAAIPGLPEGVDYLQYLVPGMVGFTMLFGASFAGMSILSDQDVGFLKEILVAPVSRTSIVLGRIAGGSTTALVQAVLILLVSIPLGFRLVNPLLAPLAAVFLVLIAITFVGFGVALASQFSDSEGFGLIIQFVIFPLFFLSGAIYPVKGLPSAVRLLAYINPLTYGVDGLRAVLVGTSAYPLAVDLGALVVSSVVMVAVGTYLFERVEAT